MELTAQKRQNLGKSSNKLRVNRQLPAVIFGKDLDSIPVTLDFNSFVKVYASEGETNLVDVVLDNTTYKVLISEVQKHPVGSQPIHVNLHKVNLTEKIKVEIPVEIVNEDQNELIKSGEALPLVLLSEISVEALPTDLPDVFNIDVSLLKEIGDSISIADLSYDKSKIEVVDNEPDDLIVKLDYAVQEEEEEEVSEEEALSNLEATGEKEDKEDKEEDSVSEPKDKE